MGNGGNGAAVPVVLETWQLFGCYLAGVNYNDLNYGSSEPVTISMTIRFDNALQTPLGSGLGTEVASQLNRTLAEAGSSITGPATPA